eukprot:10096764-Alexandrium_andersonii.AAC.1
MLWVAVPFNPMASLLRSLSAIPRVLADDIAVSTEGPQHWQRLKMAGPAALQYLVGAGARIADHKSVLLSTSAMVRAYMRGHRWAVVNARIPVLNSIRDLGA